MTEWIMVDPAEVSEALPDCPLGPQGHEWTLAIEDGSIGGISSGCETCDFYFPAEYLYFGPIKGKMVVGQDHPNLGGWHGLTRCDCNWWWEFHPETISEGSGGES